MKPSFTLYLDLDGILHSASLAHEALAAREQCPLTLEWCQHIGLFAHTEKLCKVLELYAPPGTEVVIHSSWRKFTDLADLRLHVYPLQVARTTEPTISWRYESIMHDIKEHGVENYLILDDASLQFPEGTKNLIIFNSELGLDDSGALRQLTLALLDVDAARPGLDG